VDVIADSFNLLNRTNIAAVNQLCDPLAGSTCSAGQPTASYDARQFQFAFKFSWLHNFSHRSKPAIQEGPSPDPLFFQSTALRLLAPPIPFFLSFRPRAPHLPIFSFPFPLPFNFQLSIEDPDRVGTVDLC